MRCSIVALVALAGRPVLAQAQPIPAPTHRLMPSPATIAYGWYDAAGVPVLASSGMIRVLAESKSSGSQPRLGLKPL